MIDSRELMKIYDDAYAMRAAEAGPFVAGILRAVFARLIAWAETSYDACPRGVTFAA